MKNKRLDLRKIPSDELQKIKNEAIKMRDEGISNKEIAQKFNLDPSVLSRWYKKHIKNYRQAQEILKKGRKQGTHKKLSNYQEKTIIRKLQEKSSLLSKELVQKIIEEESNIKVPITTVGDYLKKWGINSSFIKEFENKFIEKVGIKNFKSTKQDIIKSQGMIIWLNIMNFEFEADIKIYSISTRVTKNKLVFKFYEKPIDTVDLEEFVNEIATFFTKYLYVIFSNKNIVLNSNNENLKNSERVTFIHDE